MNFPFRPSCKRSGTHAWSCSLFFLPPLSFPPHASLFPSPSLSFLIIGREGEAARLLPGGLMQPSLAPVSSRVGPTEVAGGRKEGEKKKNLHLAQHTSLIPPSLRLSSSPTVPFHPTPHTVSLALSFTHTLSPPYFLPLFEKTKTHHLFSNSSSALVPLAPSSLCCEILHL